MAEEITAAVAVAVTGNKHISLTDTIVKGKLSAPTLNIAVVVAVVVAVVILATSCSGSGKVRCKDCQGHGKFTIIGNVQAFAYPTYQVNTNATFAKAPLEHLLNQSA